MTCLPCPDSPQKCKNTTELTILVELVLKNKKQ